MQSLRNLRGRVIYEKKSGDMLGRVASAIIHPANGEIIALTTVSDGSFIVPSAEIQEIHDEAVIVLHPDAICPTRDIVRVQEVLSERAPILGAKVFTLSGQLLGTVHDAIFDPMHLVVLQLDVGKSILGIPTERKLIDTRQIVRIDHRGIVVHDADAREAEREALMSEMRQVSAASTCKSDS